MTYSTALDLKLGDVKAEIDFAIWQNPKNSIHGHHHEPYLMLGEAKSLGAEAIKRSDLDQLKRVAEGLPGTVFVIAVMKNSFSAKEKRLVRSFVEWARRPNDAMEPSHHVILMTGVELFAEYDIGAAWKKAGPPYSNYSDFHHHNSLRSFAEATQSIHLDLPPFYAWAAARQNRLKGRSKA